MNAITKIRMEAIFNEWARQYAENPESFSEILDENGNAVDDYGKEATFCFCRIANELDTQGKLPKLSIADESEAK